MPSGISVVICCFNSSARLAPTLKHLYDQKGISLPEWEIILVDNCSTDDTAVQAKLIWESFPMNKPEFKVVSEPTPGLSAARQKGINESRYDYVLFCDDDNWLEENYLSTALSIMQGNPQIGALGGMGFPIFEEFEPPYFWKNQYHALAVGHQSVINGDITDERGVLYGAGMVLNKVAYVILKKKFRFEPQLSDRLNNTLLSSGDHEICLALKKVGFRIFFSESLRFKHYIPRFRTTIQYYKKLFLGFGMSYAMLLVYRVNGESLNDLKNDYRYIAIRCLKNIILMRAQLLLNGYYFKRNKFKYLDKIHFLYNNIGQLKTVVKVKNQYKTQFQTFPLFSQNA
jgi:glycosyltransferase involved in cell wall biosynthesis